MKKLTLKHIEITSFVTVEKQKDVKGGAPWTGINTCQNQCLTAYCYTHGGAVCSELECNTDQACYSVAYTNCMDCF